MSKNNEAMFIAQKYELCNRFSEEDLAEICFGLMTQKEDHYIRFAKKKRLQKKYVDRLLTRAEAYFRFVKAEAKKRGEYDYLYDKNVFMLFKKNRFIGFSIDE
ncbi:MAG: hypothetical protein IKL10_04885 [Clostridia bacterium]|nr:hypothetical protein [Clostridia bacterium]